MKASLGELSPSYRPGNGLLVSRPDALIVPTSLLREDSIVRSGAHRAGMETASAALDRSRCSRHAQVHLYRSGLVREGDPVSSAEVRGSGAANNICRCTKPCLPPRAWALRYGSTRKVSEEDRDMA
jgi:hypothetical protein